MITIQQINIPTATKKGDTLIQTQNKSNTNFIEIKKFCDGFPLKKTKHYTSNYQDLDCKFYDINFLVSPNSLTSKSLTSVLNGGSDMGLQLPNFDDYFSSKNKFKVTGLLSPTFIKIGLKVDYYNGGMSNLGIYSTNLGIKNGDIIEIDTTMKCVGGTSPEKGILFNFFVNGVKINIPVTDKLDIYPSIVVEIPANRMLDSVILTNHSEDVFTIL